MDVTTLDGFAAVLIGEHDGELKEFIESAIGLQAREMCEDAFAYCLRLRSGSPSAMPEVLARAEQDAQRTNDLMNTAADAFVGQYQHLGDNVRELLRRRVRLVVVKHINWLLDSQERTLADKGKGGIVVQ